MDLHILLLQMLVPLIFALNPDPFIYSFKTNWPLQEGYVSLSIQNLKEYVEQFSGCLIHIYNYQGIEILGLTEPVVLTRFDVFGYWSKEPYYIDVYYSLYEKSPSLDEIRRYESIDEKDRRSKMPKEWNKFYDVYVVDKSTRAKWNCQASFTLFFPDKKNAKHFHYLHTYFRKFTMQSVNFGSMMKRRFFITCCNINRIIATIFDFT